MRKWFSSAGLDPLLKRNQILVTLVRRMIQRVDVFPISAP